MKSLILHSSLAIVTASVLIGCGGGGGGGDGGNGGGGAPKLDGLSSLAGNLGLANKSAKATLLLDIDGDGNYEGKFDRQLVIDVNADGSFVFERVETPLDKLLHGQLIVEAKGYAPFQREVTLSNGGALSIDASAAVRKPALKEVVSLAGLSQSARMSSVVQFGITKGVEGVKSFSRLVSLSQLADLEVEDGRVSTYTFGVGSFSDDVKLVEATMQAFDSTNPEDIKNFPGSFRGQGLGGDKSADSTEVGLESAAFDMLILKDQNGKDIELKADKVGANVDLRSCVNRWTRYITPEQATVIEGWGDYDASDPGYQVPIWSNDNRDAAWQFVGIANYESANSRFEMCIPADWGSGYLNCDSPIAFEKPTNVCVNITSQTDAGIFGMSIWGRTASGQYSNGSTNNEGHASLGMTDTDISHWTFTYNGPLTGYSNVDINNSEIVEVNTTLCSYEVNITDVYSPYTAEVKVTAKKTNGDIAPNVYVTLQHSSYDAHNYFRNGTTDGNGTLTFMVEPNIDYVAGYAGGTADVNVDGSVVTPETADGGAYADVTVSERNYPPYGSGSAYPSAVNITIGQSTQVSFNAYDSNSDSVSLVSLKLDGVDVTLANQYEYNSTYSYYLRGDLNVSGLSRGAHAAVARVTDGINEVDLSADFTIEGNRAPEIGEPMYAFKYDEVDELSESVMDYTINTTGSVIKAASYAFSVNVNDPDGDEVTVSMTLDGNPYNPEFTVNRDEVVSISNGEHTVVVNAIDDQNESTSKTFVFNVRNQAPVISNAGIMANPVNLHLNEMMAIYAWVEDPDGDGVTSVIATDKNTSMTYSLVHMSGNYWYLDVNASTIGLVTNRAFDIVATDGATPVAVSTPAEVTVSIRNFNTPPTFYYPLYDQTVHVGTDVHYEVVPEDPEGTRVTMVCNLDGVAIATTPASIMVGAEQFTLSGLAEGTYTVACVATDAEGGSATDTATVTVTNEAPIFTKRPTTNSVDMGTDTVLECEATDPDAPVTYAWTVDGSVVSGATGTSLTLNYPAKSTHTVSCTASDSYSKSATSVTATLTVIDPTEAVAFTVDTPMPGIVVTIHDSADNLKMLYTDVTDANGDVTFSLAAGTTTTSFSLAFDPNLVLTEDQVFAELKAEVIQRAYGNCSYEGNDFNVTGCTDADWCTIMADEDSIPTWVIDAASLYDQNGTRITGADSDTNSDGEISKSEFYDKAILVNDKDASGDLSWGEVDDSEVAVRVYVDVPVRTYIIHAFDGDNHDANHGEYQMNCSDYPQFDVNVTNASGYVARFDVSGSGYGYGYANGHNEFGGKISAYRSDSEGKYDFIVHFYDESYQKVGSTLLLDKTTTDLEDGVTYDAVALPLASMSDVNMTNDINITSMDIYASYKGINFYCGTIVAHGATQTSQCVNGSGFSYILSAEDQNRVGNINKSYRHYNYYGDGTLQSAYRTSDYPMMDLDVNVTGGIAKFSGSALAAVDITTVKFSGYRTDGNGYYAGESFDIDILKFVSPTTDFNFDDLNISTMFPAGFADILETAMNESNKTSMGIEAQEFKNKTGVEILDMWMSGDYIGIYTESLQSFEYDDSDTGGGSSTKRVKLTNPFVIPLNAKKLLK